MSESRWYHGAEGQEQAAARGSTPVTISTAQVALLSPLNFSCEIGRRTGGLLPPSVFAEVLDNRLKATHLYSFTVQNQETAAPFLKKGKQKQELVSIKKD